MTIKAGKFTAENDITLNGGTLKIGGIQTDEIS